MAVPPGTTEAQWAEINLAIADARENGVTLKITVAK